MKNRLKRLVTGLMALAVLIMVIVVDGAVNAAGAVGSISGRVTDQSTGYGIVGLEVTAYNTTYGESDPVYTRVATLYPFTRGAYIINDLEPGSYRIHVKGMTLNYLDQYYNGTPIPESATWVTVVNGSTTADIDFSLTAGGKIEGTAKDATASTAIAGVAMTAYNIEFGVTEATYTGIAGGYTIQGLRTGSYMITAYPANADLENYAWELYREADPPTNDGTHNPYDATYINVVEGETVSGIDVYLQRGTTISGQVLGEYPDEENPGETVTNAIEGATVGVTGCEDPFYYNAATVAADGTYTIKGILTDGYLLAAYLMESDFRGEYYNDTPNRYQATYIEVDMGLPDPAVSGKDFTLIYGAKIEGTVDAPDDPDDIGYTVTATEGETGYTRTAETSQFGGYTIRGLMLGNYIVSVSIAGTPYIKQYYSGTDTLETATEVTVTEANKSDPVTNIDFTLVRGGSISGTVKSDLDDSSVPGVVVYAYKAENGYYGTGVTQEDGTYTIVGLKGGDYKMQVNAQGSEYAGEYYNNTFIFDEASLVTVTQGLETSGINFSLAAGGAITGTVTDGIGDPVGNVVVTAYDLQDTGDYGSALTDQETGVYTITGLLPADYKIEVDDLYLDRGYVRQYYNGVATYEEATPVTVMSGATIGAIDLTLSTGGTISGIVYESDGVTPLTGPPIEIIVFTGELCERSNQAAVRTGYTKACTGEYTINGIPPGDVYVRAVWYDYGTEWWKASASTQVCYQAETITIASGMTTPNINFQLDPDTDNDYLTDGLEITIGTDPNNNDSDADGIFDGLENRVHDTIIDPARSETDPLDPDTDNDGLYDGTEKGLVVPQGGGTPAYFIADADPATTTDANDPDTDGDGIQDGNEDTNHNGLFEPDLGETDPNTPEVVAVVGDLDSDADVDGSDLATLAGTFGSCPGCLGDLNGDDVIDAADLTIFAGNFGTSN